MIAQIDAATDQLVATLPIMGSFLGEIHVDGPRNRVYVSNADGLTIIDGG